jgi:U3 small nucleolar RNA-associated protein 23
LKNYLQLELRLLTTACLIIESEKLGSKLIPATKKLKEFVLNKCGHEKSPRSGSECIKDLVKKSHYVIATQDRDLQEWVRKQCGIALLYLHQIVPVLEEPSEKSRKLINSNSKTTATVSQLDVEKLEYFKKKEGLLQESKLTQKKKKKGGPNPLSMKKKKSRETRSEIKDKTIDKDKKKRKRIKVPKHVKELLKNEINREK